MAFGIRNAADPPVFTAALLALVLFYTMLGGMLSIILTDYIQFVVLSIGKGRLTVGCSRNSSGRAL